jgi:hypothetical protein
MESLLKFQDKKNWHQPGGILAQFSLGQEIMATHIFYVVDSTSGKRHEIWQRTPVFTANFSCHVPKFGVTASQYFMSAANISCHGPLCLCRTVAYSQSARNSSSFLQIFLRNSAKYKPYRIDGTNKFARWYRSGIYAIFAALCRPTPMPASMNSTKTVTFRKPLAGPRCDASSTTSIRRTLRRSRKKPWNASPSCTRSRVRSAAVP